MFQLFETVTRFAPVAVSAWCGAHKPCGSRRYKTEDEALYAICVRVAALMRVTRRDQPEFDSERDERRTVVRALGVTWVIRSA